MSLRSRLSLPNSSAVTPEERWKVFLRYSKSLSKELIEYKNKVKAKIATRLEFETYLKTDYEERDEAVMQKLFDQERDIINNLSPFASASLPPIPQDAPTRTGRWKQALIYLERLRLHHNVQGKKRRLKQITERQWNDYKENIFRPKQDLVHSLIRQHRESILAEV